MSAEMEKAKKRKTAFDWRGLLLVLVTPNCWLQLEPYNRRWDEELNRLMEQEAFTNHNGWTAMIGGHVVWVANHPYASFLHERTQVRPKRATILRAQEKLMCDLIAAKREEVKP